MKRRRFEAKAQLVLAIFVGLLLANCIVHGFPQNSNNYASTSVKPEDGKSSGSSSPSTSTPSTTTVAIKPATKPEASETKTEQRTKRQAPSGQPSGPPPGGPPPGSNGPQSSPTGQNIPPFPSNALQPQVGQTSSGSIPPSVPNPGAAAQTVQSGQTVQAAGGVANAGATVNTAVSASSAPALQPVKFPQPGTSG